MAVVVVVTIPMLLGMAALTIDVGFMYMVRQELQTSADAAAMAAAWTLFDQNGEINELTAQTQAELFGALNSAAASQTVTLGWIENPADPNSPFVPGAAGAVNAILVTSTRTALGGNPVPLFFAGIFGATDTDLAASGVAIFSHASSVDVVPVALRSPGFGPVDPDIVVANPGKDGPSEPINGVAFEIGEQVTVFTYGKGKKSPVHLVLNTNDIPGEAQLGKVLRGEEPPVPLALGQEIDVMGEGTGHNGLGKKLADRLDDVDPSNDVIVMPIVETLVDSRDEDGELSGNVRVVGFVAVRLDAVVEKSIPDPDQPWKNIDIELLVGTVVHKAVSGTATLADAGVVAGASLYIPTLIR